MVGGPRRSSSTCSRNPNQCGRPRRYALLFMGQLFGKVEWEIDGELATMVVG